MSKEIVKYSNKMNNIPLKNFEKVDLDFFHAICAKVREKGSELVEIPLDEIKLLTEYKSTSLERFKSDLIRMNEKLRSCHGIYETDDEIGELPIVLSQWASCFIDLVTYYLHRR